LLVLVFALVCSYRLVDELENEKRKKTKSMAYTSILVSNG